MTKVEAIQSLMEGHGIFSATSARAICETLTIPFSDALIMRWESAKAAFEQHGFIATSDAPGSGVDSLDLSYYVCEQLGIEAPGHSYTGKGFQAKANARAIAQKLSSSGIL